MAAVIASTPAGGQESAIPLDTVSTIRDPRSRSISPHLRSTGSPAPSSPAHHPDLNTEVATLSNKLIDAINHQTILDDSLANARHELEYSRRQIRQLEASQSQYAFAMRQGILISKSDVDEEISKLKDEIEDERALRATAENEKKKIDLELETLTTALFEEANQMVAAARKDKDATEKKNEQLKSQLSDMETLLASQQEQLTELKTVLARHSDRDDLDTNTSASTAPTTPSMANSEHWGKIFEALHISPNSPGLGDVPPSYPTSFTHLMQPVLRTDLPAYEDFTSLLRLSRSAATSRTSSGSYGGLNVMGLGSTSQSTVHSSSASNASTSSSPYTGSPATPSTAASSKDTFHSNTPLKDTRFYKRVLAEDIEPTLRLDTAPGLSWLARRTVLNAMSEGNLVVEPMPGTPAAYGPSCSLCNESRQGEEYARRHRFRTSESEKNAQKYPLCGYCVGRVRATCDFLGFLRMVKDGHWRTVGEEGERGAWEESVRLREGMYWARIGGGVVPAFVQTKDSSRPSTEGRRSEDLFEDKRASMAQTDLSVRTGSKVSFADEEFIPKDLDAENVRKDAQQKEMESRAGTPEVAQDETARLEVTQDETARVVVTDDLKDESRPIAKEDSRLSITIPGDSKGEVLSQGSFLIPASPTKS